MMGRLLSQYHHRAIHVPRTRRIARALASLAEERGRVRSLLEVGAGDGRVAQAVAEILDAGEVQGVDLVARPGASIPVAIYDGGPLPFETGRFDAVILSDVLHHAEDPERLLTECMRVAGRFVLLKDHLAFGALSETLLLWMDQIGNRATGVPVRGRYFHLEEWFRLVDRAGGRIADLRWPLAIHDLPWRAVTRSELQFAARIEHAGSAS